MSFPIPVFNLLGSLWKTPRTPAVGLADFTDIPNAVYLTPHLFPIYVPIAPYNASFIWATIAKTPSGLHVYNRGDIFAPDKFTVAACYKVEYKDIFYRGFPQEFEGIILTQCNLNGTIPRTY